jgi:uncharacterized membrane protein
MKIIGIVATFIVCAFLSALYSGYVLSVLWAWFVVPTFGLPALTIPVAIGLALIVSFMAKSDAEEKTDDEITSKIVSAVVKAILKPSFALLFGWVATLFM